MAMRYMPCTHSARTIAWMMWMDILAPIEWVKFHYTSKTKAPPPHRTAPKQTKDMIYVLCALFTTLYGKPIALCHLQISVYHVYKVCFIRFNIYYVGGACLSVCFCLWVRWASSQNRGTSTRAQCLYTYTYTYTYKHTRTCNDDDGGANKTRKKVEIAFIVWAKHFNITLYIHVSRKLIRHKNPYKTLYS